MHFPHAAVIPVAATAAFLVDTLGTPDPNDDVLVPQGDPFTAGPVTTGDFCQDFLSATSG
jgi:hypothetical protein